MAKRLGLNRQTLYTYWQGNITLEKIVNIAGALDVEIWELFKRSAEGVFGFVEYNDKIHRVQSKQDLQNVLNHRMKKLIKSLFDLLYPDNEFPFGEKVFYLLIIVIILIFYSLSV